MKKNGKLLVEQVLSEGDLLAQQQADFYDNYIMKANDVLYGLLADLMRYSDQVLESDYKLEIFAKMRSTLSAKHNIKVQKNTSDLTIIVKYVVRTNRKNAHVYARVLDMAYRQDVMANELEEFIRQNGGIDRIRASNTNLESVRKKKAKSEHELKFIKALLDEKAATPITEFSIPHEWSSQVHDSMGVSTFFYPICMGVLGGYKVVGVVPMDIDFEKQILSRVFIDLGSKGSYSEVDKQQIARAKEIISPAYQLKMQEERDRAEQERRSKKQVAQQLAVPQLALAT
ncbi:hypothetical protein [Polynucleobacter sp. MWH-HuK1]|uniref:hypothetical protein n=1 Tax=Polynucleobacter sp. MWH-HuK1 TaxID=1743158 RepID=UPI001C0AA6CD|nr:hypothetical protein [Polynucleobacter sp. MWH-HuK1]MBU3565253.1 hypothetical protein [Polynucleobacter sp. MWH-HuK1]